MFFRFSRQKSFPEKFSQKSFKFMSIHEKRIPRDKTLGSLLNVYYYMLYVLPNFRLLKNFNFESEVTIFNGTIVRSSANYINNVFH